MTNAIEQTKREMYEHLDFLKYVYRYNPKPMLFGHLESAMEDHLEELRKALVASNQLTVQCAQHSAESFVELERRLADMKNERDAIQARLQAIDHAYFVADQANKAAGEELRAITALCREQATTIGDLYVSALRARKDHAGNRGSCPCAATSPRSSRNHAS